MLRRNLVLLLLIVLTGSAVGGAAYYYQSVGKKAGEGGQVQNHVGDLRFRFRDYGEAAVPASRRAAEVAKGESRSAAAPGNNPRAAGGEPETPVSSPGAGGSEPKTAGSSLQPGSGGAEASAGREPYPGGAGSLREQIEQKYLARLQALASGYEAELNGLILSALNECRAARKENPNADLAPIIKRYYLAGRALEAECDSRFYPVLADFKSELKANSFPLDAAARARETYEARKSAKAGEITSAGR